MIPFQRMPTAMMLALIFVSAVSAAAEDTDSSGQAEEMNAPSSPVPKAPEGKSPRFKSDIWLPLASGVAPGLGQYIQGDWGGLPYSAVALGGLGVAYHAKHESGEKAGSISTSDLFAEDSWRTRRFVLGNLAYQGMGFMSAYSTFRLSVSRFQQEDGRYDFLGPPKETAGDLLLAPFRFDHLAKPTTWVPIGLVAAIAPVVIYFGRNDNKGADWTLSGDDFAFAAPLSFNAGVSEEAAFRGWLYPVAYQYTGGSFWLANGAQALVFAAAHYDKQDLPLPIPQLLMGFYLGWVTKRDQWSLSESIFIHSWWDMLLLGISIATNTKAPNQVTRIGASVPIPW